MTRYDARPDALPGVTSSVRHVMFDADDVLQHLPGGWFTAMEPYLGERAREFLIETWAEERPALTGQADYVPLLAAGLRRYDVTGSPDEVYRAVWHHIAVVDESLSIVRALRDQGYGVHFGTNQERGRGEYMRTELGYDELFDVSCYSYDLEVAKPDAAFFVEAARRIGADRGSILFIDDRQTNVDGALAAGMHAERWELEDGHAVLLDLLEAHGVPGRPSP